MTTLKSSKYYLRRTFRPSSGISTATEIKLSKIQHHRAKPTRTPTLQDKNTEITLNTQRTLKATEGNMDKDCQIEWWICCKMDYYDGRVSYIFAFIVLRSEKLIWLLV